MSDKPLSQFALHALNRIVEKPVPAQEFNAGVNRKLVTKGFATYVMLPTPYATRKGDIGYLQVTDAGRRFQASTQWQENIERDVILLKAMLSGGLPAVNSAAMLMPDFAGGPDVVTVYAAWIAHPDRKRYRAKVASALEEHQ